MSRRRLHAFMTPVVRLLATMALCWALSPVATAQDVPSAPAPVPPPIPVGPVKMEDVFHYNEEYKALTEAYLPIKSGVEFLKSYPNKVRIEVFYGSW